MLHTDQNQHMIREQVTEGDIINDCLRITSDHQVECMSCFVFRCVFRCRCRCMYVCICVRVRFRACMCVHAYITNGLYNI